MKIRTAQINDREEWARLRNLLWPDTIQNHLTEIDDFFTGLNVHISEVFVIEEKMHALAGFLELGIRNYAEGSMASYVPYVEGFYVAEDYRKKGCGKQLLEMAEKWALSNDFQELASDAELRNTASIAAHQALGFREVARQVCFIKQLK